MHALICGHGYIGQEVARQFLALGWKVTAVSREVNAGDAGVSGLDECAADLSSRASVTRLAADISAPDFVVHCASSGRGGAEAYRAVYRDGCRHLLDAFPAVPVLYTSSTSVYGQTDGSEVSEDSVAEPDRETGQILRETEKMLLEGGGIVFRLAGIYGPHRSVILRKFLDGSATLEEDGRRVLNQIHRDDAASAIVHAATCPLASGIYNVCDDSPRSQLETYRALAKMFDRPVPPSVPRDLNRKRGWTHKRVSNAKLRATGWRPHYPSFLGAAAQIASDPPC